MRTSPKKELQIYHNHSKPKELADSLGEKERRTLGEKRENDSFSPNMRILLAFFISTEWTFIISYMVVLVGGMECECASKKV